MLLVSFWHIVHRFVECLNDVVFLNAVLYNNFLNVFFFFLLSIVWDFVCWLKKKKFPKYLTPEKNIYIENKLVLIDIEEKFQIEDVQHETFIPVPRNCTFARGQWHSPKVGTRRATECLQVLWPISVENTRRTLSPRVKGLLPWSCGSVYRSQSLW